MDKVSGRDVWRGLRSPAQVRGCVCAVDGPGDSLDGFFASLVVEILGAPFWMPRTISSTGRLKGIGAMAAIPLAVVFSSAPVSMAPSTLNWVRAMVALAGMTWNRLLGWDCWELERLPGTAS